jgi:AcrR family transcriptional regulator
MAGKSEQPSGRRMSSGGRRRRSAEEIKDRLLSAARAEFGSKSFTGATTAAIARRADVAEVQMFRYFPSKADLFHEAVFAPLIEHFRCFNDEHANKALDEESAREQALLYITELQEFLGKHARELVSLFVAQTFEDGARQPPQAGIEDLQSYFSESVSRMSQRSRPAGPIDPEMIVRVAFGTLLGCLTYRHWLFSDEAGDKGEIDEAIRKFILQGVGPLTVDPGTEEPPP